MKKLFYLSYLLYLNCFLISCAEWDLPVENFIQVSISAPELIGLDSIKLSGNFSGLVNEDQVVDYGFIYKPTSESSSIEVVGTRQNIGASKADASFDGIIDLEAFTQYTFAAFADLGNNKIIYSDTVTQITGGPTVVTDSIYYFGGLNIQLWGHLNNTDRGFTAVEHGFCWGPEIHGPPVLGDSNFINLGYRNNDAVYTANPRAFHHSDDGIAQIFRAYAKFTFNFQQYIVYDENPDTWINFDGEINYWSRVEDAPELAKKGGQGRLLAVRFTKGSLYYQLTNNNETVLVFDPSIGSKGMWDTLYPTQIGTSDCLNALYRRQTRGFTIGEKAYFGTGNCYQPTNQIIGDFWEYDPVANTITKMQDFPGGPRVLTAGFSIGNKGYIGLEARGNKKDFYEFDPLQSPPNQWKRMEDYPSGHRTKLAFTIDSIGYVGSNPMYAFDPSKTGTQQWKLMEELPGEVRSSAVGVGAGRKGYIGTGKAPTEGLYFYEFDPYGGDPDNDGKPGTYRRVADFPGIQRQNGIGFTIGENPYFGFGSSVFTNEILIDFWAFHP